MEKYKGKTKEPKEPKEPKQPKKTREPKAPEVSISDLDAKLDFYNQVKGEMKEMGSKKKSIKEEILETMNKNGLKEYRGIKVKATF